MVEFGSTHDEVVEGETGVDRFLDVLMRELFTNIATPEALA